MAYQHNGARWWEKDTVAVVTGGNKGIGLEICRELSQQGLTTILTARDEQRGQETVAKLASEGAPCVFHQLDITDQASVDTLAAWLKDTYGKVDVLVNNAGMAYKGNTFGADEAATTLATNFQGTARVCTALHPLLPRGGRVVNVTSIAGQMRGVPSEKIRRRFWEAGSEEEVASLAREFVEAVRAGTYAQDGWPASMYGISKLAENMYTRVLAKQLEPDGIVVNACCPGYVATDMSSYRGHKTPSQGADTPVWLALLPPGESPVGGFFQERKPLEF